MTFIDKIPWWVAILSAFTLGLAPFIPRPHLLEKLQMLADGALKRPLDIFDLCLHGLPWLLLAAKIVLLLFRSARA